jgi:hypothetical protein
MDLVMKRPSDVFEVGVIEEVLVELLHPDANLLHADAADLGQCIPEIPVVTHLFVKQLSFVEKKYTYCS